MSALPPPSLPVSAPRSTLAAAYARVSGGALARWQTSVWPLALWLTVVGNLPLWHRVWQLDGSATHRLWLLLALGLVVLGAVGAWLSLLFWPRLFKPLASVMVLAAALSSHFMWQFGVVIDSTMIANVLHTERAEVLDLLSGSLLLTLAGVAAWPLWWIWRHPGAWRGWRRQAGRNLAGALGGLALALVVVGLSYQGVASLMRSDKSLRYMINPLNTVYGSARLAADQLPRQVLRLIPVGEDVRLGASYAGQSRPPLLVLVVGETARAKNWGLNGYARQTTPALARWQAERGLLNFSQVTTCGTNTQVSVPCLFSPLSRDEGGHLAPRHENLLDVLQRAGLAVLWVDNQTGCKGVCERVAHINLHDNPMLHGCDGAGCLDEALLNGLDERIAALDPARRARGVVVVLHQMGSHGPAYSRRSPASHKPFSPECGSVRLSECEQQQIVNAYDNSIVYTDHVLDRTLHWLDDHARAGRFDSGLIYVSDHGESLGENGLFLHGMPYALAPVEQTRVPMVAWFSDSLRQRGGMQMDCLRQRQGDPVSHDHFFHTVLGVLDLQTAAARPAMNAVWPCLAALSARDTGSSAQ